MGRICINTSLALGLALIGFIIDAIVRQLGNPPKVAQKFFLIFFIPSVFGCFLLFGVSDHVSLYLNLYQSLNDNSVVRSSSSSSIVNPSLYIKRDNKDFFATTRLKQPSEVSNEGSFDALQKSQNGSRGTSLRKLGSWAALQDKSPAVV